MSNASDLLRMLEPAVRPISAPGSVATKPRFENTPFEKQSFDQMLAAASESGTTEPAMNTDLTTQMNDGQPGDAVAIEAASKPASPLAALGQLDRIENASLRTLFNQQNQMTK